MKPSSWNWLPPRSQGIWRFGPLWLKPLMASVPYLTVVLALLMILFLGDTMTREEGILFALPDAAGTDAEATSLVALAMPKDNGTMVFFDDARYLLDDGASRATFARHLAERLAKTDRKTLLLLADRRVSGGDVARLAAVAKSVGSERILFATRSQAGEFSE